MKKLTALLLVTVMTLGMLAGCAEKPATQSPSGSPATSPSAGETTPANTPANGETIKVALALAGTLGDKGFNDNAKKGAERAAEEFGIEFKIIEMTNDKTKFEPTLMDLSESGEYDLITAAGFSCKETLQKVAPQFPDQKYFLYDANADYDKGDYSNIYSNTFLQNEASYLGGIVAARMTTSDLPDMNADKNIGCIAMMDMSVINDFLVGYIEGALSVDPDMKINSAYIGAVDAAKAKDMASAQFQQKTDIVFQVAASAGLGVIEAAKEKNGYVIGVDQDQAMALMESDPASANRIITSVLKRVDIAVYRVIKMLVEDPASIPFGTTEALGMGEDCVGIAKTDVYQTLVDDETKALVEEAEKKIASGEIKVGTAFGMDADTLTALRNSVKP